MSEHNIEAPQYDDIEPDGTVSDHLIETYYRPATGGYVDTDRRFVAIILDDGGTDIETRIPFDAFLAIAEEVARG